MTTEDDQHLYTKIHLCFHDRNSIHVFTIIQYVNSLITFGVIYFDSLGALSLAGFHIFLFCVNL